jgi:hypothetical protein
MTAIAPENINSTSDIVDFLKGSGGGMLVVYGATGSGKSSFALACKSKVIELGMECVLIDAGKLPQDVDSIGRIDADVLIFDEIRTGKGIIDMISFVEHGHKIVFTFHNFKVDNEPSDIIESMKLAIADYYLKAHLDKPAEWAQELLDLNLACLDRLISNKKCLFFHMNFGSNN